ncbi:MAG: hypothetical protein IKN56_06520 [Clostridia bacterium]|nr:hypothetical protein [Clostridia bacterium]
MKKIVAIILSLVMAFSATSIAFAIDILTCPECGKKFVADEEGIEEYNMCIEKHRKEKAKEEDEGEEDDGLYKCPTCGKTYDNIPQYNACIESHKTETEHNWDFYVSKTLPDLLADWVALINDMGIMEVVRSLVERVVTVFESFLQRGETEPPVAEVTE